ncbi:MAG: hypothetical protein LEGION0398_MBIBDBAK_00708 [Legionellaceae bacterium]
MSVPSRVPHPLLIVNFIIITLFYSYTLLLQMLPNYLMEQWMLILQTDYVSMNHILIAFFYSYTPTLLIIGLYYDRANNNIKLMLIMGILLAAISASLYGLAQTFLAAFISRILSGISAAIATIGLLIYISRYLPHNRFATYASILPLLYSLFLLPTFYPHHLILNIAHCKLFFLSLSLFGFLLFLCLQLVFKNKILKQKPSFTDDTLISFNNYWKIHLKEVFKNNENWLAIIYSFAVWLPLTLFGGLWGIPYLQTRYHLNYEISFHSVNLIWLGLIFSAPIMGYISDVLKRRAIILIGCSLIGLISILMILFMSKLSLKEFTLLLPFLGIAASGQNIALALINDKNKPSLRGTAFGFVNLVGLALSAFFQPLLNMLLQWEEQFHQQITIYTASVYERALIILILCYSIALLVSGLLINKK